jgi:hypothetical protein
MAVDFDIEYKLKWRRITLNFALCISVEFDVVWTSFAQVTEERTPDFRCLLKFNSTSFSVLNVTSEV